MDLFSEPLNQILIVAGILILAYFVYSYMYAKPSAKTAEPLDVETLDVEPLEVEQMDNIEYFDNMDNQENFEE